MKKLHFMLIGILLAGIIGFQGCSPETAVANGSGEIILNPSDDDSHAQSSEDVLSAESVSSDGETSSQSDSTSQAAVSSQTDESSQAAGVSVDSEARHIEEETPSSYAPPITTGISVGESDSATYTNYIVNCTELPTYEKLSREVEALRKTYPDLIKTGKAGYSVQQRVIYCVTLGHGRKKVLVVGGMHSREFITVNFILRSIEDYSRAYYSDTGLLGGYNIKQLLDEYTLYFVPNCNPDGSEILFRLANPMVNITAASYGELKCNANGVNLNRNFPFMWYKSNTDCDHPDASLYIGESEGSEPETQTLMRLCNECSFEWMLSLHIRGDCIYWSDAVNTDVAGSSDYVGKLCSQLGFFPCQTSTELSLYGGGFENWFRANFGKPGFCVELMPMSVEVSPTDNANLINFDASVRYPVTRTMFAVMMSGKE